MARVIRAERTGPVIVRAELQDARERATSLLAAAAAEAATLREQAVGEGRAAGMAEITRQLQDVSRLRERALSDVQHEGLRAVLLVAATLLGETLQAEPERIATMLNTQLARVRRAHWLIAHVHPADAEWLNAHPEALANCELEAALELHADPEIARGGCVLESNLGQLDARIDTRLRELGIALGLPEPGSA